MRGRRILSLNRIIMILKDPPFRPVKSNILYPHQKKKHIKEMLREVKEQMNHEVEAILDSRLLMTDDRLNDEKKTPAK